MTSTFFTKYLIERMQQCMGTADAPQELKESLAIEVETFVTSTNIQIRRCASWIDSGRFVEAAALSEDCDNLVMVTDELSDQRAIPNWNNFCFSHELPQPPSINQAEVELLNNAGTWSKTIDDLTSEWIESNVLQQPVFKRWETLKLLEKNDDKNPIWDVQNELLSPIVLTLLIKEYEEAKSNQDIPLMKTILQSIDKTAIHVDRKRAIKRIRSEIKSASIVQENEELHIVAEDLATALCEGDHSSLKTLVAKWDRCISNGGTYALKPSEYNQAISILQEENAQIESERFQRGLIAKLEHLLDNNSPSHEIEVMYYEIKEKNNIQVPENLENRVAYVIDEERAHRRRKTSLIISVLSAAVLIVGALITVSVLRNNRQNSIASYAKIGESCLVHYDLDCYTNWEIDVRNKGYENTPAIQSVIASHEKVVKEERAIRANAQNAFTIAVNILKAERPEKTDFISCNQRMEEIASLPIHDLSVEAIDFLRMLTDKKNMLANDDTNNLEHGIDIAETNFRLVKDPSQQNKDTQALPSEWKIAAEEYEAVMNVLYTSIHNNWYASAGIIKRAHSKIHNIKSSIARMNDRAQLLTDCITAKIELTAEVPHTAYEWGKYVSNYTSFKSLATSLYTIQENYWIDLKRSVSQAEAIQHWKDYVYPNIRTILPKNSSSKSRFLLGMLSDVKPAIERHLELFPTSPYSEPATAMLAIVTDQKKFGGSQLMKSIAAFSDITKITLNAGRYFYGKGAANPEHHCIQIPDDVNNNTDDLTTIEIGISVIQQLQHMKLSKAIYDFTQSNTMENQDCVSQTELALAALYLCQTESRIAEPILSYASCKHIARQLLNSRKFTLSILAPEYYKLLKRWNVDNSNKQLNWPVMGLNSNANKRLSSRNEAEKLTASMPDPQKGISELEKNLQNLLLELQPVYIQGILQPKRIQFAVIGSSDPVALIVTKTNNKWSLQNFTFKADGTVVTDGRLGTSPALIYGRRAN